VRADTSPKRGCHGFLTGNNEGENIGLHFHVAHGFSSFRILGCEHDPEHVARRLAGMLDKPAPALGDDCIERLAEAAEHRPCPPLRGPGHEVGKTDDVERIDAPRGCEKSRHRFAHGLGVAAKAVGEDGTHQAVERQTAHFAPEIENVVVRTIAPALDQRGGGGCHCRGESQHHLSSEPWSQRASLAAPLLVVDGDKPVAQSRGQDPPLERALAVVGRIFNEYLADGRWVAHHRDPCERKAAFHDRLFEMRLGPALDRIVPERAQQGERA
jgi:hypothetical protein